MDSDNFKKVKEIFQPALELPEAERENFLAKNCPSELREEVESLLKSFQESENFIEKPAADFKELFAVDNRIGQSIGQYKIVKEIGKGGMGLVYLALREDDQFSQRVALKVVKRGFDNEEVLRRFRNERQILASLKHPNIAQLIDGGTTEEGSPYFVMEYVEGLPLIQFCNEHEFSTNERLDLFKKICSAVQHAHQNLVIHRDLKPSNIIVTLKGEPKLLDFGIAKFLNPELMGEFSQTRTQFRVMTPEYASPEQIKGSHITTSTDVYSLGIILYELLTNERPYQLDGKNLEEVFQTITQLEPNPPSKVISRQSLASRNNQKSNIKNRKSLSGDLDNIVLMALRKEPVRRYKSVEQLSDDVQRHLKGLPVIARPNTFSYRAEKFFKRNLAASVVGALLILTLISGLIISLRQTAIAYAQEKKAITEANKSQKITKFMEKVLNYANPSWYAEGSKLNGQAKLSEVLDDLSDKIETEFPDDLDIQAELHHKSAEIYLAKGNVPKALIHAENALKIRRSIFGDKNAEVAKDMYYLGSVHHSSNKYNQMSKLYEESAAIFREVDPNNPNLPYLLEDFGASLNQFADYEKAEQAYTESLELFRKKDGEIHYNTARLYLVLAIVFAKKGENAKADDYFQEGEKRFNQMTDKNLSKSFVIQQAKFEFVKGNSGKAETLLETSLAENSIERNFSLAKDLITVLHSVYSADGNYLKLADLFKSELERIKQNLPRNEVEIASANLVIATALYRSGKNDEARKYFDEGFSVYKTFSADSLTRLLFNEMVAECLFYQKRYNEAKPILENIITFHAENYPPNDKDIPKFKEILHQIEAELKK